MSDYPCLHIENFDSYDVLASADPDGYIDKLLVKERRIYENAALPNSFYNAAFDDLNRYPDAFYPSYCLAPCFISGNP